MKVVEESMPFPGEPGVLIGREGDVFDLETKFLGDDNILRLHGAPGVGALYLPPIRKIE